MQWGKTQITNKFPLDKINGTKMTSFFFVKSKSSQFCFWDSYISWSARWVFHSRFDFASIKVCIFVNQNAWTLLNVQRHNSFQNLNNRKTTHSFAPRTLIFKLQQDFLKLNDICVSWSSLKTDLVTNFFNFENWSFENVSFS